MDTGPGEITRLLGELREGKRDAEARLMEAVLPELKRRAASYLRGERHGHTLQTTALVNEAYLELTGRSQVDWKDGPHFFAVAAEAMRRILVDYARARNAAKRGGGRHKVELSEVMVISEDRLEEALAVDEALTRLAEWDPRQSRVVEMRFFGGLSEEDVAEVLGVSSKTVKRDWKVAKAWLHGELGKGAPRDSDTR